MRRVRWLAAARKTSGALEWEYSSRKWCSTSQRYCTPEPVGQLDLLEGVGDQLLLAVVAPGAGQLVLVEDAELHGRPHPMEAHPIEAHPMEAGPSGRLVMVITVSSGGTGSVASARV